MEINIHAMIAQAKLAQKSQPFGVSFDTLPENFPENVPRENQMTGVSFLLAWVAKRQLLQAETKSFLGLDDLDIAGFKQRTPIEILEALNREFLPSHVLEPGRAFLLAYYWPGWQHSYGVDFDKVFVTEYADPLLVKPGFASTWHVPGTWEEFEKIEPLLDLRFSEWK